LRRWVRVAKKKKGMRKEKILLTGFPRERQSTDFTAAVGNDEAIYEQHEAPLAC
jgi:hypothetical protein